MMDRKASGIFAKLAVVVLVAFCICGFNKDQSNPYHSYLAPESATSARTIIFDAPSVGRSMRFSIVVPKDYNSSDKRYPALYLLHGYGGDNIEIKGLTEKARIKIFNIVGELVLDKMKDDATGTYKWDTRNKNDQKVASGVYIYLISDKRDDKSQVEKGKIAIIR